jgi:dienelactone hydrolase
MSRPLRWLALVAGALFLAAATWLGVLERRPPPRAEIALAGGIPATLYLPGSGSGDSAFLDAPPREQRPPAIVLMHGFASDRLGMSVLARRLALSGYAVLAFDASGHGTNRNPFRRSRARPDSFHADYAAAVDQLRADPRVDGTRIVAMGHSMGAGASLDFASRDSGLDAVVLISGGGSILGPHRPPNALFLYASADPGRTERRSRELAERLAGRGAIEVGRTYGDPARGTGVRLARIAGADHATIVWSEAAALEIVRWLDGVYAREPTRAVAPDARLPATGLAALALLLGLPALGAAIGGLVPRQAEPKPLPPVAAFGALVLALAATMPLLAVDVPASLLSVEVGDAVVSHLGLAGIALLAGFALRDAAPRLPSLAALRTALPAAALAAVAIYVLLIPLATVLHRVTLTPERLLVFALAGGGLLPFALAFQTLLRRGSPRRAALLSGLGRLLVLCVLLAGVGLSLLSGVVLLMLPALALAFVLLELLASGLYASSRHLGLIALIDAAWLGFMIAASMPVRL